ncbi:unnamed protein product [Caenorhabditis angaria]|uniref:Uncharacterized protein n=1 Tax=Caenorhabditis angaria TaxID=860376 RepID=A0A9P1J0I4_9PELO|nr:unnamed protein product [Caenorhabditis angaria]
MKDEYSTQECSICSAQADGMHYGALSCRSCNAFFRRTVVEKAKYECKHSKNCKINSDDRCSCRYCRYMKCIEAGMRVEAVQPRRDPTGSQKDRRKRMSNKISSSQSPCGSANSSFSSDQNISNGSFSIVDAIKTEFGFSNPHRNSLSNDIFATNDKLSKIVKTELEDEQTASTSGGSEKVSRMNTPNDDDQQEFRHLVFSYGEHQRIMQLSFSTVEQFLDELENGQKLRAMDATDVNKLSAVELTGLLYWIEKMRPYRDLPADDKSMLLKRYSVRKLSLDHFYSASKHPTNCEAGEFVMNNYTFVPSDRTGFELPDDDEKQIEAKKLTFAPTYSRFWNNVIIPFVKLRITDAEIVYLHILLLWSQTNNEHVTQQTRDIMKQRRDWAMCRLFDWYHEHDYEEPGVRFGQITLILGEIEIICDMHCQDFQVAKLFEFCDMSKFWYESLCYAPCNTNTVKFDPNLFESLKTFTAISVIETHGGVPPTKQQTDQAWQKLNNFQSPVRPVAAAGVSGLMPSTSVLSCDQQLLEVEKKLQEEYVRNLATQNYQQQLQFRQQQQLQLQQQLQQQNLTNGFEFNPNYSAMVFNQSDIA